MTEIAIIGSDMQEVIGTAIALYLLSNKAWVEFLIICKVKRTINFINRVL